MQEACWLTRMSEAFGCENSLLENIDDVKALSTRFVRTWRAKVINSKQVWLRRSRLVAREFAWIDERFDLFSPASNAISSRILPLLFMRKGGESYVLGSVDVADAFLTVPQKEPTKVVLRDACGSSTVYGLGKVLPGKRAGSQLCYEAITELLCRELGMQQCDAYPNLLSTKIIVALFFCMLMTWWFAAMEDMTTKFSCLRWRNFIALALSLLGRLVMKSVLSKEFTEGWMKIALQSHHTTSMCRNSWSWLVSGQQLGQRRCQDILLWRSLMTQIRLRQLRLESTGFALEYFCFSPMIFHIANMP